MSQQPDDFNAGEVPSLGEELDEEFWTLITCEKQFQIDNPLVEPSTFEPGTTEAEQGNILTTIKDIVAIIKGLLEISGELIKQMEDCAATSSATVKEKRDGFLFDGENRKMGYKMIQKGIFFDGKATKTKIKGKAFLWVKKGNGKYKKDRKARAGISFCAKEWDGCVNKEWPSDAGVYRHPRQESRKKAKVVYKHSSALSIEKSWHFLQFKFGRNGEFAGALNLLGTEGCISGSNTNW